jgi:type I restriction enzyme S subunit
VSEWERRPLSQVATRLTTKNAAGHERVMTVSAAHGLIDQDQFFTKSVASKDLSGYWVIEPGDFVYNKSTSKDAPFGVVARYDGDEPAVVTPLYICFRADESLVTPRFLELACNGSTFFDSLSGMLREGARAHGLLNVRLREFFSASVPVPPFAEQRRITDMVDVMDKQIEALRVEIAAAAAARRFLVRYAAAGVETVALGDVAAVSQGKGLPKERQGLVSGEVSWFKIADMTGEGNEHGYTLAETRMTSAEVTSLGGVVVPAGSVVFPRVGGAVLTEKKRILDVAAAVDENHLVLTPVDKAASEYLLAVMEGLRLADYVQPGAVPSLNMSLVRAMEVPWSPTGASELGEVLGAMRHAARKRHVELGSIRAVRSALLKALLSESISIPESYDDFRDLAAAS